jgi:hypothetical protein
MIRIKIKGVENVKEFLRGVPLGVKTVAAHEVAKYLIGDSTHGLKHEPYYKHINRYAGFPEASYVTSTGKTVYGWNSEKQHKYVMAAIARGEIKPGQDNRTHKFQNAWEIVGDPPRYIIENKTDYGGYLMGDQQTRMHNMIGWRRWQKNVADNMKGAMRAAILKIDEWLKTHK